MSQTSDAGGRIEMRAVGEIRGNFVVPGYQRGYRWGPQEVNALLDDVWSFSQQTAVETYCLQPVVLKPTGGGRFELVDGQQRLTTLYILAKYLHETGRGAGPAYDLAYETRDRSRQFLKDLSSEVLADKDRCEENIDYAHMARAYATIAAWFAAHPGADVDGMLAALATRVKVIWYEAPDDVKPADLFTRLNAGRIPLTSAELIKAVLLARDAAGAQTAAHVRAAQWDDIERELSDEDYWGFLRNPGAAATPNRIELLFALLAEVPAPRRSDPYALFDALHARVARDRDAFWRDVLTLRATLREWYERRDLYHHVGYLIAAGAPLGALWNAAASSTRAAFRDFVAREIRARVDPGKKKSWELDFESDGARCERVLLLANVEAVRRRETDERYPFRAHKARRWSLEHVNPQGGDAVRSTAERLQWLDDHRRILDGYPCASDDERRRRDALRDAIAAARSDLDGQRFNTVAREVLEFLSIEQNLHTIGNLALLAGDDNSALSNATFAVKQDRVVAMDRSGSFIPVLTLRVFLKYDSPYELRYLPRWTVQDQRSYLAALFHRTTGLLSGWMPADALLPSEDPS